MQTLMWHSFGFSFLNVFVLHDLEGQSFQYYLYSAHFKFATLSVSICKFNHSHTHKEMKFKMRKQEKNTLARLSIKHDLCNLQVIWKGMNWNVTNKKST